MIVVELAVMTLVSVVVTSGYTGVGHSTAGPDDVGRTEPDRPPFDTARTISGSGTARGGRVGSDPGWAECDLGDLNGVLSVRTVRPAHCWNELEPSGLVWMDGMVDCL